MRLYLDASPVIFAVEATPILFQKTQTLLNQTQGEVVASDLTEMEVLVIPIRTNDQKLIQDYDRFFKNQIQHMLQFNTAVFKKATAIRAHYNLRTPDALHVAIAELNSCDCFLTNDYQLLRYPHLNFRNCLAVWSNRSKHLRMRRMGYIGNC